MDKPQDSKKKFSFEILKRIIKEELFYREFFRDVNPSKEDSDDRDE
jgi:hypothetical protein